MTFWSLGGPFPEALRRDPQRPVELAGSVLPGHDLGQLDDGIVVEVGAQAGEQFVRHVTVGDRDAVGVLEDQPLDLVEERTIFPVQERQ